MRHSRWQGAALSGRVSRSRAMPVGGPHRENWPALQAVRAASSVGGTCRDGSHPDGWGMRRRGPAGRCADRRSAFQACLRGHLSQWGGALTPERHRRGHFGGDAGTVPSAPLPVSRRASCRSAETGAPAVLALVLVCGARHSRWQGGSVIGRWFRASARRSEARRSSRPRAPRDAGRRPALLALVLAVVRGTHAGGMERHRRGFRAPARCRSETGAPGRPRACSRSVVRGTHAGRMERHRRGFRAPARCRSETGAPGRARACSRSVVRGTHAGGMERHRYWFRAPARCRSETGAPGVPALVLGLRGTHGGGMERYRYWFRAPARCRSEDGAPGGARHSRWREGTSSEQVSRSRAMPV